TGVQTCALPISPALNKPIVRRLNLLTWQLQELAIAISEDVANGIRDFAGTAVPIQTVWNGVNTVEFTPSNPRGTSVRSQHGIPGDASVVGTVAVFRDSPQKRLDLWLESA